MNLNIKTHAIILGTERFDECVVFYRNVLGLPIWYVKDQLVCFRFDNSVTVHFTAKF